MAAESPTISTQQFLDYMRLLKGEEEEEKQESDEEKNIDPENKFEPLENWSGKEISDFLAQRGTDPIFERASIAFWKYDVSGRLLMSKKLDMILDDILPQFWKYPSAKQTIKAHLNLLINKGGGVKPNANVNLDDSVGFEDSFNFSQMNSFVTDFETEYYEEDSETDDSFTGGGSEEECEEDDDDDDQPIIHLNDFLDAIRHLTSTNQLHLASEKGNKRDTFSRGSRFSARGRREEVRMNKRKQMTEEEVIEAAFRKQMYQPGRYRRVVKRIGGGYYCGYVDTFCEEGHGIGYPDQRLPMLMLTEGTDQHQQEVAARRKEIIEEEQRKREWLTEGGVSGKLPPSDYFKGYGDAGGWKPKHNKTITTNKAIERKSKNHYEEEDGLHASRELVVASEKKSEPDQKDVNKATTDGPTLTTVVTSMHSYFKKIQNAKKQQEEEEEEESGSDEDSDDEKLKVLFTVDEEAGEEDEDEEDDEDDDDDDDEESTPQPTRAAPPRPSASNPSIVNVTCQESEEKSNSKSNKSISFAGMDNVSLSVQIENAINGASSLSDSGESSSSTPSSQVSTPSSIVSSASMFNNPGNGKEDQEGIESPANSFSRKSTSPDTPGTGLIDDEDYDYEPSSSSKQQSSVKKTGFVKAGGGGSSMSLFLGKKDRPKPLNKKKIGFFVEPDKSEKVVAPQSPFLKKPSVRFLDSSVVENSFQENDDDNGDDDDDDEQGDKAVTYGLVSPTMQLFGRNKASPPTPGFALPSAAPSVGGVVGTSSSSVSTSKEGNSKLSKHGVGRGGGGVVGTSSSSVSTSKEDNSKLSKHGVGRGGGGGGGGGFAGDAEGAGGHSSSGGSVRFEETSGSNNASSDVSSRATIDRWIDGSTTSTQSSSGFLTSKDEIDEDRAGMLSELYYLVGGVSDSLDLNGFNILTEVFSKEDETVSPLQLEEESFQDICNKGQDGDRTRTTLSFDKFSAIFASMPDLNTLMKARNELISRRHQLIEEAKQERLGVHSSSSTIASPLSSSPGKQGKNEVDNSFNSEKEFVVSSSMTTPLKSSIKGGSSSSSSPLPSTPSSTLSTPKTPASATWTKEQEATHHLYNVITSAKKAPHSK